MTCKLETKNIKRKADLLEIVYCSCRHSVFGAVSACLFLYPPFLLPLLFGMFLYCSGLQIFCSRIIACLLRVHIRLDRVVLALLQIPIYS